MIAGAPDARFVVGMSGGVDSSVAAAVLAQRGNDVVGITMHLAGSSSRCCSLEDADDARRVAERLGIRFYVANYTAEFRAEVMEPFADAYLAGRTPIPCIACNKRFKFDHLWKRARALGADRIATGHYARIEVSENGECQLLRAVDRAKDQSYFLYNLSQDQLRAIEFPLGSLSKDDVRKTARELGLATADKPESQEICFVPDGDYARVVEAIRPDRLPGPGVVVDEAGRELASHQGIHRFTVGQRRGLGLSGGERRYVSRVDAPANRVVVGPGSSLDHREADVEALSFTASAAPEGEFRARVRVRHRHEPAPATVRLEAGRARVHFDEPVRAVTPGQAAVFYDGEVVLGGGTIGAAR